MAKLRVPRHTGHFVFSAEYTIGMVRGLTALKHYGTMALWHYGNKAK